MLKRAARRIYQLRSVTGTTIKAAQQQPTNEKFKFKDNFVVCRICTRWCVIAFVWLWAATAIGFLALYFGNVDGWFVNAFAPDPNKLDASDIEAVNYGKQDLNQPAMILPNLFNV